MKNDLIDIDLTTVPTLGTRVAYSPFREGRMLIEMAKTAPLQTRSKLVRNMLITADKIFNSDETQHDKLVQATILAENAARAAIPNSAVEKVAADTWMKYWRASPHQTMLAQTAVRRARDGSELKRQAEMALNEMRAQNITIVARAANDETPNPVVAATAPAAPAGRLGRNAQKFLDSGAGKESLPVLDIVQPPVTQSTANTNKLKAWAKKNLPAIAAGAAVGIGARFALAAMVTTVPGFVVTVGAGAVIGSLSNVVSAVVRGERDSNKLLRSAATGAVTGAAFSMLGFGVADLFSDHSVIRHFFAGHGSAAHTTATQVAATHVAAAAPTPAPHIPDATTVTTIIKPTGVDGILSASDMKGLPSHLQQLAASDSPEKLARFCKEASHELLNGSHKNAEAAVKLMQRGLEIAEKSNIHTAAMEHVQHQLHADLAYSQAWGKGTAANMPEALEHAKRAGTAIHNFGGRLVGLLKPKLG